MVVVRCGGHLLVLGVLGGVALGGVLGIGAGASTAMLLVAGIVVLLRRRNEAACVVPPVVRATQ